MLSDTRAPIGFRHRKENSHLAARDYSPHPQESRPSDGLRVMHLRDSEQAGDFLESAPCRGADAASAHVTARGVAVAASLVASRRSGKRAAVAVEARFWGLGRLPSSGAALSWRRVHRVAFRCVTDLWSTSSRAGRAPPYLSRSADGGRPIRLRPTCYANATRRLRVSI